MEQYLQNCGYQNIKIQNLFLTFESALKNILTDDGWAYAIWKDEEAPLYVEAFNIALEEKETLDERFQFEHSVSFIINGYANHTYFGGRNQVILEDTEGTFWLIDPAFPMKITYNYNLTSSNETTTFTFSTISNHPLLRLEDFSASATTSCNYTHTKFESLQLNEQVWSLKDGNSVQYSNDGFKGIEYLKNSATLTENYDGENVTSAIEFVLPMSSYLSSWHYNLLEFSENKYAAIVTTSDGRYLLNGFDNGYQPSFTIIGSENENISHITITLANQGEFVQINNSNNISYNSGTSWNYTAKYNAFECTGKNTAKYLLQEELNPFNNPTGRYKALSGYESYFPNLNIIGTFDTISTFACPSCQSYSCNIRTSLQNPIIFNGVEDKLYSFIADSPWSAVSSNNSISINPISGLTGEYELTIANAWNPFESGSTSGTIAFNYCDGDSTIYNVNVEKPVCLPISAFSISSDEQRLSVAYYCPVSSITSDLAYEVADASITFSVPMNQSSSAITYSAMVNDVDSITINQTGMYSKWVTVGNGCSSSYSYCEKQRLYTGTTADNINTPTDIYRNYNCTGSVSSKCYQKKRWFTTTATTCNGGTAYSVLKEQYTLNGTTWYDTGYQILGEVVTNVSGCSEPVYEWQLMSNDNYFCDNGKKYQKYQLYVDGEPADAYKMGELMYGISTDCPNVRGNYERWVSAGTFCNGFDKYNREQKEISDNGRQWTATTMYRMANLVEEYSHDCGYGGYEYQWVETAIPLCNGTSSYYAWKKQKRKYGSDLRWTDLVPTVLSVDGEGTQTMQEADEDSPDCGYVSSATPEYSWATVDGFICSGCSKYTKEEERVSYDEGETYQYMKIYRPGELIEENSGDCGCGEPIET